MMAQPNSDDGRLLIEPPSPPEYPPDCWITKERLARKAFLDDRVRGIEQVARRCLAIDPNTDVYVRYLEKHYPGDPLVTMESFRVTILDKQYHFGVKSDARDGQAIASQIAAMDCIRQRTDVFRVPMVIAYDVSDNNELGRSWIAREYIPGDKICDRWKTLAMEQKCSIAQDLARYLAQLYLIRFDRMGSLVYDTIDDTPSPASRQSPTLWSCCLNLWCRLLLWFCWLWSTYTMVNWVARVSHRQLPSTPPPRNAIVVGKDLFITDPGLPAGPFTNSRDWFLARLQQTIRSNLTIAEAYGYSVDIECSIILESMRWSEYLRQRTVLRTEERATTIYHPIKESSILVSDDGKVAGLLDWDNISVCPLWMVTAIPAALLSEHKRDIFLSTISSLAPHWVTLHSKRKMDRTIAKRVRDLMNCRVRSLLRFKEDVACTDDVSGGSWSDDDDTLYEGSDIGDDR